MLTKQGIEDRILELSREPLEEFGVDVFDFHVKKSSTEWIIDMAVDKPEGGIKLDECVQINRVLINLIDQDGFLSDEYSLLLSSPGLDRPLKTARDFKRLLGRNIKFVLKEKIEGRGEWIGPTCNISDQQVTILVDGKEISIPFNSITKAVQYI